MAREIAEIPDMLQRQLDRGLEGYRQLGRELSDAGLHGIVTCARGSSDHAATFLNYLFTTQTGLPVASLGPSVASVYGTRLRLKGFACIAFSQSGGSPDLANLQDAAKAGGARTIALVNEIDSPLGRTAETALGILAGPERSVAATKSFVGMLFASLAVLCGFCRDEALEEALRGLPRLTRAALDSDWSPALPELARTRRIYCIGRGPGLAIASESALKFKETCRLHAEAYSAAELLHGPIALADHELGALIFDGVDASQYSLRLAEQALRQRDARTYLITAEPGGQAGCLATPACPHPLLLPVIQIAAFYQFVELLSRTLGENPDNPHGLQKVTQTL